MAESTDLSGISNLQNLLKWTFVVLPVVVGLDKFFGLLVNWEIYFPVWLVDLLPWGIGTTVIIVGIVEIIAGVFVLTGLLFGQATAQEAPELSDTEIAHVAVTANKIDINHAKIALERSENEAIRKFANIMISDHKAVIQKAVDLVNKLGVTPEGNAVSQSLMKRANNISGKLKSIDSSEFDEFYIENEVAYHEAVINAVENVLIPQAKNEQLKSLLKQVVRVLWHHKEMAKEVQENTEGGMSDSDGYDY